jgi:hypothetical protein
MERRLKCDNCPGEVLEGRYVEIRVPDVDEDGFPKLDRRTGELFYTVKKLPFHVPPQSAHDPMGLVPVLCEHGLPEHPLGFPLQYGGRSWVRSRYSLSGGNGIISMMCVVDQGAPRPDDLTEPGNYACTR